MKKILLPFLFISVVLSAQEKVNVDLSSPKSAVYTHLYFLQSGSYQPEKAAQIIKGLPLEKAIEKAKKIKDVLDGKGLFVDFGKIPTNPNYRDTIGYSKLHKYVLFPIRMPSIWVEKSGNNWYYSDETVQNIDAIYNQVFPWYVQKVHDLMPDMKGEKALGIDLWKWVMIILIIICCIVIYFVFRGASFFLLEKVQYRITKKRNKEISNAIEKMAIPIGLLINTGFIGKILPSLQMSLTFNKWSFFCLDTVATVFWVFIFLKLVHVVMKIYAGFAKKTKGKLDDQLVPILSNFFSGVVIFLGVLKLLTIFGVNATALIAGVSIGGLALALASQDTVKNMIGTIMIFLDKPFHIGDWIVADIFSGEVEQVGFRSTRVRGADTSIYQIPNSKLSEITINNKGLLLYRRYSTEIGVRYDTPPELLEAFVKGIREIIIAHPETRSESYNVEFIGFGDSALMIMVNVYFKSLAWGVEQSSKHRLHMAILKLSKALGVEFAFPSSTIMVEQFPDKNVVSPKYQIDEKKMSSAIKQVVDEF